MIWRSRSTSLARRAVGRSPVAPLGIEHVAQRVLEDVAPEYGQHNGVAREHCDPRGRRGIFLRAALQHQPPVWHWLLNAEAEIGQRCLGQDCLTDKSSL